MGRRVMPLVVAVLATILAAPAPFARGRQAASVDVNSVGPAVGAHVPAFELEDQNGHRRSLVSLMGPKGLVLVFFRSADW